MSSSTICNVFHQQWIICQEFDRIGALKLEEAESFTNRCSALHTGMDPLQVRIIIDQDTSNETRRLLGASTNRNVQHLESTMIVHFDGHRIQL